MPSIAEEIARALNISTATVSRALNDRPGVGEELRARVLAKAQELNYAPTATARGLATSQTLAVGFFIHEKPGLSTYTDPFYGEILQGVEQGLSQTDYHVAIASLTDDVLANPASFRFTRERRVDGMILAGPDIPSSFILAMIQSELPVVLVDNRLEYSQTHSVTSDDESGAYMAAQHLLSLGHREIGAISGPIEWASSRERIRGYQQALAEAGLKLKSVHTDRTTIESGEAAFQALAAQYPQMTALCAVNDSMALGAIRAARAMGWRVPDELSVVGFDDITWAQLNDPPLTTISIPKRQIGSEAVHRLIRLLKEPGIVPTNLMLSVQLIERGSTGPARPQE